MTDSSETPDLPLPSWPFRAKDELATRLHKNVFGRWLGEELDEEVQLIMFDDLCPELELKTKRSKQAASDTLAQYRGRVHDDALNRLLCLQFAWNAKQIQKGRALCKFTCVTEFRWLPFQIGAIKEDQRFGRDVAKLSLLCFGGFAAGYVTVKVVPWRFLRFFAYQLGFNRRWRYEDEAEHLLNLRFAGLIEPSDVADLRFHRYHTTTAMKKHNAKFIHERAHDAWEEDRPR